MPKPKFKVAVSTGLWGIARGEELATVVRKLGYALTRGTSAVEIAGDVPHEIDFSEGKELRYIAKKQGIDLNLHGSLTIPFCIPEMVQWREAQDHVFKSIKSAVYGGCKYVNFHSCLHYWVEMLTYVGARFEIIMCDWEGRFISHLLKINEKVREYFIRHFWEKYGSYILAEAVRPVYHEVELEARRRAEEKLTKGLITQEELPKEIGKIHAKLLEERIKEMLRKWFIEEREWGPIARTRGDYVDACKIIANYLFFAQDPIWVDMVKMYEKTIKRYEEMIGPLDPKDEDWLEKALKKAEELGDKEFKEFYYGVIGAKFLYGHLMDAARWMAETKGYEKKGLPSIIENELKMIKPRGLEKEKKELMEILKNLKITIETPDARDPREAGRYMLWKLKQIYVTIKHLREDLKKEKNPYWNKIFILVDFEHLATQGIDPSEELRDLVKHVPDVGKYILCIHSNYPSPLHSHSPIEIGEVRIYELLWILREAGLGEYHPTYILFERGGFRDPFKRSITALRLMVHFLEKNVPPKELPPEFFGVAPRRLLAEERQWVGIFQHAMDPLKGLLKVPEEEYTFLGRAAVEVGKRPEEWKREEYR